MRFVFDGNMVDLEYFQDDRDIGVTVESSTHNDMILNISHIAMINLYRS
jgi:hypothetical protein